MSGKLSKNGSVKGIERGNGPPPPRKHGQGHIPSELVIEIRKLREVGDWLHVDEKIWVEKKIKNAVSSCTAWARRWKIGVRYGLYRDENDQLVVEAYEDMLGERRRLEAEKRVNQKTMDDATELADRVNNKAQVKS